MQWALRQWPQLDPLVEGIVSRISSAERRLHRSAVDTLEGLDLSHGEFKVLMRLIRGPRSNSDIAKELLVSTGTMTNRLDKLEGMGLVRREPDPADRRGIIAVLTEQGRSVLDRYIDVQARREQQLLRRLTEADKRTLNDLLRKLLTSLVDG